MIPLTEDDLRSLTKSSLADTIAPIGNVLHGVLQAAIASGDNSDYAAACVSALCGLTDRISSSQDSANRCLISKPDFINGLFDVFFSSMDILKTKLAKRLLVTATRLIINQQDVDTKDALVHRQLKTSFNAILHLDCLSVKASLSVLDHCLEKSLVSASDLLKIHTSGSWHEESARQLNGDGNAAEVSQASLDSFATQLFAWAQFPDCSIVVSRLVPRFFASLSACKLPHFRETSQTQLWLHPVRNALDRDTSLLAVFETYLLPGLFTISTTDQEELFQALPFKRILSGDLMRCSTMDIQLCLIRAKVDDSMSAGNRLGRETCIQLGMILLDHAAPNVRISALGLLLPSKSFEPFPSHCLFRLQQCIPHFHKEAEPKSRNEFINLMKILASRLKIIINRLRRSPVDAAQQSQPTIDKDQTREKHEQFVQWYMEFLVRALRPTASYQSHITALRVLQFYFEATMRTGDMLPIYLDAELYAVLIRSLSDLTLDSFDDVRHVASVSLGMILQTPAECERLVEFCMNLEHTLRRAELLARRSGRADHSDGLGRLSACRFGLAIETSNPSLLEPWNLVQSLLVQLESEIKILQTDFPRSIGFSALHGVLISLR